MGFNPVFKELNFMKIHRVEAELYHEGGQTDGQRAVTKLKVPFRNFANAPKNKEART